MPNVEFYTIHGGFSIGLEYSWRVKWLNLDFGFWALELCWSDYA